MLPSPDLGPVAKTKLSPLSAFLRNSPQQRPTAERVGRSSSMPRKLQRRSSRAPSKLNPERCAEPGPEEEKREEEKETEKEKEEEARKPEHGKSEAEHLLNRSLTFCGCGNKCAYGSTECAGCRAGAKRHEFSGYLYGRSKSDSEEFVRYYYILLGKELFRNPTLCHNINRLQVQGRPGVRPSVLVVQLHNKVGEEPGGGQHTLAARIYALRVAAATPALHSHPRREGRLGPLHS